MAKRREPSMAKRPLLHLVEPCACVVDLQLREGKVEQAKAQMVVLLEVLGHRDAAVLALKALGVSMHQRDAAWDCLQ